ncbi:hypothetical protein MUK42_32946 [Musa troglodytarum]|uniref:Uncharacterized protein n=1 Tax=Musa troglodytarum TaxID=320322 RepID=A0A9E7FD61_9LILI|nr:hypothetical protein MUK42_32946 [Musa troglodytarum]
MSHMMSYGRSARMRHRSRTGSRRINPVKHEPRLNRAISLSDLSHGNAGPAHFALNPRDSSRAAYPSRLPLRPPTPSAAPLLLLILFYSWSKV